MTRRVSVAGGVDVVTPAHRRPRLPLLGRLRRDKSGRAARVRPGLDFSLVGLVYSSMMMFLGLAAINSQANLLFGVFGLMIGVLLVSGVISRLVLMGVQVDRRLPVTPQVGRPTRLRYVVGNRKRFWPSFGLILAELDAGGTDAVFDRQPHAYVLHTASGMTAEVAADVVPRRRGWVNFERIQISTSFPFGFIKRAVIRRKADRLLVGPARAALEPTALVQFLAAESTGLSQRPRPGGNDELVGTRDYRPGDPPRSVHWRRSARTAGASARRESGGLVVKEMHRTAPPRLLVLVDTYAADGATRDVLGQVEKNLAVAASLVAGASDRGLSVGLVVWRAERGFVAARPERDKRHRDDLLQHLAEAERNANADVAALLSAASAVSKHDTTTLLVTAEASDDVPTGRQASALRRVATATPALDRLMRFPPTLDWASMADMPH